MTAKKKMAKKIAPKVDAKTPRKKAETKPKFTYTTKPGSLRRLLQEIPKRPKPPKFDKEILQGWGFRDGNDYSMIRVLKEVGMLNSANIPTDIYTNFMNLQTGATAMAPQLREVYKPLFHASHEPWKESADTLRNLFHIHSGGSAGCIEQQIQTFKALTENTSFETNSPKGGASAPAGIISSPPTPTGQVQPTMATATPGVNINIHIHLPENKSRRDYECMIEDIGRYIFGKEPRDARDEY